ncbi:MAG TPA: GNAT family N-acetyltransferase [Steroidobacteraceae bacterium]|jgi:RimJ/RimL family protein N-acetyltransferase|nr:GNAT family N-acetyltransferase [Steroidobacteraceae bacterium]
MSFELQPRLQNDLIKLEPLEADDFERLYAVASDPLIWEQHPSSDRYQRPVFENFFKGAMESRGAFCVFDNTNGELIGSSRYCDYDEAQRQISVGYTFIARSRWARHYNLALKTLMLDHAFKFVDRVTFKVGINNWRSRKAMEKLGGIYIGEESVSYSGEPSHPNVVFKIDAKDWANRAR